MTVSPVQRPRLVPARPFPAYAYLPGRFPHPVRHPLGHSYQAEPEAAPGPDEFAWGVDLFNHGYYWEAHEAWEALWQAAKADPQRRLFYKGLILLAACGVKIREGKPQPARRHGVRAAATLRRISPRPAASLEADLGMPVSALADLADATSGLPTDREGIQSVFDFLLGRATN